MSKPILTTLDNISIHRADMEYTAVELLRIARNARARESEGALILTQAIAYISLAVEKLKMIEDGQLLA